MFGRHHRLQQTVDVLANALTQYIIKINLSLEAIRAAQKRMEIIMSQETDALHELIAKVTDLHDDVKARINVAAGELSAEGKSEMDKVTAAIDAFQAEIGDANGSDNEAPPVEETPPV